MRNITWLISGYGWAISSRPSTWTRKAPRAERIGAQDLCSFALHTKAWAHRHLGQWAEALLCASEAPALARKFAAPLALAFALGQLAETPMALVIDEDTPGGGCPSGAEGAAANFGEAATILRGIGKSIMAYAMEIGLADLLCRRGQIDSALHQQLHALCTSCAGITPERFDEPAEHWPQRTRKRLSE